MKPIFIHFSQDAANGCGRETFDLEQATSDIFTCHPHTHEDIWAALLEEHNMATGEFHIAKGQRGRIC